MFARLIAQIATRIEARRSLQFLLARADDHLLADIGLTRAGAEAMLAKADPISVILPVHDPRGAMVATN